MATTQEGWKYGERNSYLAPVEIKSLKIPASSIFPDIPSPFSRLLKSNWLFSWQLLIAGVVTSWPKWLSSIPMGFKLGQISAMSVTLIGDSAFWGPCAKRSKWGSAQYSLHIAFKGWLSGWYPAANLYYRVGNKKIMDCSYIGQVKMWYC